MKESITNYTNFRYTIMLLAAQLLALVLLLLKPAHVNANMDPIEGRYSFSLTTFHPSGKLPQLEHATKASTLGPPIIALSLEKGRGILLTSIQSLPSPLINEDGTSRFVKISNSIVLGHTGVNADGRVLCEAAQRLSVEHAYTFHEEIPIDVLLEEMALLFQEYTMKPACRPFGCSLIVASMGISDDGDYDDDNNDGCNLFRIDPAGTVTRLQSIDFAGRGNRQEIIEKIRKAGCIDVDDIDEAEKRLTEVMRSEYGCNDNDEDIALTERISSSSLICAKLGGVSRDTTIRKIQL